MSLEKLKQQACQLSIRDRLALVSAIIQSLQDDSEINGWQYLESRPRAWRKQLYLKERKLLASIVRQDMIVNQMSPKEAAENWNLPIAAIEEVICYCESHQELIKLEADQERDRLADRGVSFEPTPAAG